MRPYPLMPPRSQVGNIEPYEVLHGLGSLGAPSCASELAITKRQYDALDNSYQECTSKLSKATWGRSSNSAYTRGPTHFHGLGSPSCSSELQVVKRQYNALDRQYQSCTSKLSKAQHGFSFHGLGHLGEAPYDLRMYHNEGVGRLGDVSSDPVKPKVSSFGMFFGGTCVGLGIGWLLSKR